MGSMVEVLAMDDPAEFFAPVASDVVDSLIGQYQSTRQRIDAIYGLIAGEMAGAMEYILEGNSSHDRSPPSVKTLFSDEGKAKAIAALNSAYWSKAMHLTDVLDYMPQARRDEWNDKLRNPLGRKERNRHTGELELLPLPEFEEDTVRSTLQGLISSRQKFFGERVDGIFRALSGEHVTNCPQGFGKRMIISYVHGGYYATERCGYINDLRAVIAKFMGRDEPKWNSSQSVVNHAYKQHGQWITLDGGALRIRCYLKGTAHLEVHPDMAWRLNSVLASMYPRAIPPEFRSKPKKPAKDFVMMIRPLPFAVLEIISNLRKGRDGFRYFFGYGDLDKHAKSEAIRVLESIGGVLGKSGYIEFDYAPSLVIAEVIASGCIPDDKSHQFYPTPDRLAHRVVELAEIEPHHECLEPSAGTGAIADLMPKDRTLCLEISSLRCKVLESKEFRTVQTDFLKFQSGNKFDRICMNPPFDQGRWKAHLEAAASLVNDGGRIVAILPSGAKNSASLPGFDLTWHGPFDNEFAGASVSVVILVAEKK